ncbi:MAG: hypothetical protein ACYC4R_09910 [Anaerolineae bacterium]
MAARHPFSIRSLYLYVVALITLVMIIFSTVNLLRNVVELAYPEPRSEFSMPKTEEGGLDAEEVRLQQEYQLQWSRRNAVLGIAGNVAMLLLAGPLYLYHWRKIQQEAAESATSPGAQG